MNEIKSELGFIYIYNGKKFLTRGAALKYKKHLEFIKNEEELIKECEKIPNETKLTVLLVLWVLDKIAMILLLWFFR